MMKVKSDLYLTPETLIVQTFIYTHPFAVIKSS